jgi:hypothetical protein
MADRVTRLRVACALLAPLPPGGEGLRTPLEPKDAIVQISAMSDEVRNTLSAHIDWVLAYEAQEAEEAA